MEFIDVVTKSEAITSHFNNKASRGKRT